MSKFCCTCMHWEGVIIHRMGEEFGICSDVIVNDKIIQDTDAKLGDETVLYTEKYFGCVYWRDRGPAIVDFKNVIDDKTGKPI